MKKAVIPQSQTSKPDTNKVDKPKAPGVSSLNNKSTQPSSIQSSQTKQAQSKPSVTTSTQSKVQTASLPSITGKKVEEKSVSTAKKDLKSVAVAQSNPLKIQDKTDQLKDKGLLPVVQVVKEYIPSQMRFLQVFEEKIINKIMSFLLIEDWVKVATISKLFRKIVVQLLEPMDNSKVVQKMRTSEYLEANYAGQQLVTNADSYKKLIKSSKQLIETNLIDLEKAKSSKNKDALIKILTNSTNFFMKVNQNKTNIISYLNNIGFTTVYSQLSNYLIQPSKVKIDIPEVPYQDDTTPLLQLAQYIYRYFEFQQQYNKIELSQLKYGIRFSKKLQNLKKIEQVKKQLISKYQRPIICLKRTSNIFNYINKNTIQLIFPFLTSQEQINLISTSKPIFQLAKEGIISVIEGMEERRKALLLSISMTERQAQAAIYLWHYHCFSHNCNSLMASHFIRQEHVQGLMYTLWQLVHSEHSHGDMIINSTRKDEYTQFYYTWHNIENANIKNIGILKECLSKYTDDYVEGKEIESGYQDAIILLQKYLKGIQIYLEEGINNETLQTLNQVYQEKIYKFDRTIYRYKKIFKINQETLEIYTFDMDKPTIERRIKQIPRRLFD